MGVSERAVYNWLNVLLRKGVLEKLATHLYRLKPYTIVKGNAKRANENAVITDFDPHKFDDYLP
jgi:DNA-binding IclR family transcriptional regulator